MRYSVKNSISDVGMLIQDKSKVVIKQQESIILVENGLRKITDVKGLSFIYLVFGQIFCKINNTLNKITSDFKVKQVSNLEGGSFIILDEDEFIIKYSHGEVGTDIYERRVSYIRQENKLWDHPIFSPLINFNTNILIEKDDLEATKLIRRELHSYSEIWTYHLPPPMHTYGRFYLVDQVLIFRTNTAHLIGLDIETGKELWRLEKCNRAFHILEEQQKMFSLQTNRYQVIDPIKGEKVIEKRFEDMEEKLKIWPSPHLANVYPEGLHFVSNYQGTRFGMVDIYNSEIAWVQDHNPEAGRYEGLAAPVLHQDKLYLHDAGKTLYVYERV